MKREYYKKLPVSFSERGLDKDGKSGEEIFNEFRKALPRLPIWALREIIARTQKDVERRAYTGINIGHMVNNLARGQLERKRGVA